MLEHVVAEVEQRGAKSGRLTEGPQRLLYATGYSECISTPGKLEKYV